MKRREFLEFLGLSSLSLAVSSTLMNCALSPTKSGVVSPVVNLPFSPLPSSSADKLELAEGFQSQILIRWGDKINSHGEKFGFNNDFLALTPLKGSDYMLWVNHEYVDPLFVSGYAKGTKRTKEQVKEEMHSLGGSLLQVRNLGDGQWKFIENSKYNRRLDAFTEIPFITKEPIRGKMKAVGTFAGCSGGITPWKTILSCEENYQDFYGEDIYVNGQREHKTGDFGWEEFYDHPPEHYGWVVEVNPLTGAAKKLTALGRFAHESATLVTAADGRCVVYLGDDRTNECLYKFIAAKPGSLHEGELFVANLESGEWRSLSWDKSEILRKMFKSPTETLIRTREAARAVGGTPLDRPEDIEVHPVTRAVFTALSNNKKKGNFMGSILKLEEQDANPLSLKFKSSTFITGGVESGIACPDNLVFDNQGNLWLTSDMSDESMHKPPYVEFGNNSLFYIPMSGADAGRCFRVANAPFGAEFTGPMFSPDYKTLFMSVQHPGEGTTDLKNPLSHWPDGGTSTPRPSVVTIGGPALDRITGRG